LDRNHKHDYTGCLLELHQKNVRVSYENRHQSGTVVVMPEQLQFIYDFSQLWPNDFISITIQVQPIGHDRVAYYPLFVY